MSTHTQKPAARVIEYPDGDGLPMAENTLQFEWIVTIKEGLAALFADRTDVFVAGDLFWYPVEGDPKTCTAPDALVAFGRPQGYRGSYKQWEEAGVAPQVVFEVLSPGNRAGEMLHKFRFYERFGVEEYYVYDPGPNRNTLEGWLREGGRLIEVAAVQGWTSPRLGVRFDLVADTLHLTRPDGQPVLNYFDLFKARDAERRRADAERQNAFDERRRADAERQNALDERRHADAERQNALDERRRADAERQNAFDERWRADAERQRADAEQQKAVAERQRADAEQQKAVAERQTALAQRQRAERLAERLRTLGIDPEAP